MKAEIKKKYSICVEIESENAEEIIHAIDYFDVIRPDREFENHYPLFEFQKALFAKLEEITKE